MVNMMYVAAAIAAIVILILIVWFFTTWNRFIRLEENANRLSDVTLNTSLVFSKNLLRPAKQLQVHLAVVT